MQLVPASTLAYNYGVKTIVYGPPGTGKTPIIATCPRPVVLACETGMGSMQRLGNNIPAWQALTSQRIDEFFNWFFHSAEARNFDTLCIDSASQMCEIKLNEVLPGKKDPRQAYGDMERWGSPIFNALYYMQQKHIYIVCKEETIEEVSGVGANQSVTYRYRPYFPGKALTRGIRHLYDLIMRVEKTSLPAFTQAGIKGVFRTCGNTQIEARDRFGKLAELEPTNFTHIINKCMSA
jgi:hypothetical protein